MNYFDKICTVANKRDDFQETADVTTEPGQDGKEQGGKSEKILKKRR